MSKFFKYSEYALGIPDRSVRAALPNISAPQKWEFVLHDHEADRAGRHFDMRLGDPATGQAHSWVIKSWPGVGEKVTAVLQPTHTVRYMDFSGVIPSGYGKGKVSIANRTQVEITKSEPNKVTFYIHDGPHSGRYTLLSTGGNNWLFMNHTMTKELGKYFSSAPKYKMKDITKTYTAEPSDVKMPKIDGAYAVTILRPNKTPIILSSRVSKKTGLPIEYTPKIYNALASRSPEELGKTILRTEVFATTPDGKEIPNRSLGGILNSNVWKSREQQQRKSTPLRLAITDIITYKGKDVSALPYTAKLPIIQDIAAKYPLLQDPRDVEKKTIFKEGNVIWRNNQPFKYVHQPAYDVYVKNIFADKNNAMAGGFEYSLTPDGPAVGKVGTGWKHKEKIDMLQNPNDYIGRVAKVKAREQHPSGALRAPSFINWHLDK